jgi:hypothetical protein
MTPCSKKPCWTIVDARIPLRKWCLQNIEPNVSRWMVYYGLLMLIVSLKQWATTASINPTDHWDSRTEGQLETRLTKLFNTVPQFFAVSFNGLVLLGQSTGKQQLQCNCWYSISWEIWCPFLKLNRSANTSEPVLGSRGLLAPQNYNWKALAPFQSEEIVPVWTTKAMKGSRPILNSYDCSFSYTFTLTY